MKKITLVFNFWNHKELGDYLRSLNGVKKVFIDDEKDLLIEIEYDENTIFPNVLKYEVLAFMEVDYPSLISFDLHEVNVKKKTIVIKDVCCEYCYMDMIDDLFSTKGITSAKSDFDVMGYHYNINLYIEYNPLMISENDLRKIEEELNK